MLNKHYHRSYFRYLQIAAGAAVYAFAISMFLDPNSLAPGGVTGIAMILSRCVGLETGTWILLINIPILLVGLWKFGVKFLLSTLYGIVLVAMFTNIFSGFAPITRDDFLACIAGSVLLSCGIGLVFKAKATTGGTDIIVKLLRLRFPHMKTGGLFLTLDAIVVVCSWLVFQNMEKALYAGICIFLTSQVLDIVLYGRDEAKLIYIISDHHEQIAERLLAELGLGLTYVKGVGAYSGKEKEVIMCAVKKRIAPKTEDVVRDEDPLAFMIVTSATEIYGEGYKSYFSERL